MQVPENTTQAPEICTESDAIGNNFPEQMVESPGIRSQQFSFSDLLEYPSYSLKKLDDQQIDSTKKQTRSRSDSESSIIDVVGGTHKRVTREKEEEDSPKAEKVQIFESDLKLRRRAELRKKKGEVGQAHIRRGARLQRRS